MNINYALVRFNTIEAMLQYQRFNRQMFSDLRRSIKFEDGLYCFVEKGYRLIEAIERLKCKDITIVKCSEIRISLNELKEILKSHLL